MPAPAPGHVRVFSEVNVGPLYALRWNDVRVDNPFLAGWRARGFVADVDHAGNAAPADLPQRCCGAR